MALCANCKAQTDEDSGICPSCGTQTGENPAAGNTEASPKVIFILAYLGILFFLPLVSCPNSKTGRFHANQGLLLLIAAAAGQIAIAILSSILLAISWRLWSISSILSWAWSIAVLALAVIGMVNAGKGEQKPLPVIGKFKIIK